MSQRSGGEGVMEGQREGAKGRRGKGARGRGLVVGTYLLSLVVAGSTGVSLAAEPASGPTNAGQNVPQQHNQERFLQNFISQSLGQGTSSTATPPAPLPPSSQLSAVNSQPSALSPQPSPP